MKGWVTSSYFDTLDKVNEDTINPTGICAPLTTSVELIPPPTPHQIDYRKIPNSTRKVETPQLQRFNEGS